MASACKKEGSVKKRSKAATSRRKPEMRSEYHFSQGVRGKHAKRYAEGTNVVLLSPDVAAVFPDSAAVNQALRTLMKAGRKSVARPTRS